MQKIYFNATYLLISNTVIDGFQSNNIVYNWDKETIKQTIYKLQQVNSQPILLIQQDVKAALDHLTREFTVIQAGGGLAITPSNEVLLIYRRGKWDLPKGKLDKGETIESCAVREVEEETGLKNIGLGPLLQKTYHTYSEKNDKILKETFWYLMHTQKQNLLPQTEEDIQECRWVPINELPSFYANMQPSVKDVIKIYLSRK